MLMARHNPPRIPCDQVPEPTDDPTLAMLDAALEALARDTDAMEDNLEALGDEIALLRAQLVESTTRASRLEAERDAWLCTGCQPVNRDRR
jgi:class 3 adenylate cyclase